jgi:transcriptional/translational regulatory protein YebC/TACO1
MAKVREAINRHNARLSSTSHLFERTGVIRFNIKDGSTFDDVWEMAVENGAQDVRSWESDDDGQLGVEVVCDPSDLHRLTSMFSSHPLSHEIIESEAKMIPSGPLLRIRGDEEEETEKGSEAATTASWLEEEDMIKLDNLVAALEEGAECHRVWSNVDGWPA